jgi:predicted TIM-barrel fold metal-dependent hydrolase
MSAQPYRVVSADSHFVEPPDLFTSRVPAQFRERAPRTEWGALGAGMEGEFWVAPESASAEPRPVATYWGAGMSMADVREMNKRGYPAAPDFVFDPAARLRAQDRDGVSAEVMYTSAGMGLFRIEDGDLRRACFSAFNGWAAEYCSYDLDRLQGCAMIDVDDVEAGARELERAAKLGLRAGMITGKPLDGHAYSSKQYDRIWATAQEVGIPLALHVHTSRAPIVHVPFVEPVMCITDIQESLAHMLIGGVFERFPNLKVILTEVDASWIPHFLHRADHYFKRYANQAGFSMTPSEYLRRNVWATFQDEGENIPYAAALFSADRVMWASDFPHMNSTYPQTREFIDGSFAGMKRSEVQKIVADNASALYRLAG